MQRQTERPDSPSGSTILLDDAMETGQGADDDPEIAIGDRYNGEAPPDPDGDGRLTVEEAKGLLGAETPENETRETQEIP